MKFCRNLQRVIDITDPEWAPYWTNYKMLKKFLKALVPPDAAEGVPGSGEVPPGSSSPHVSDGDGPGQGVSEEDKSEEDKSEEDKKAPAEAPNAGNALCHNSSAAQMSQKPGEVAFFKLLNSELRKAIHFFDKALLEFEIREARVREGIDIMRKANSLMVTEKWSLMAKSLYRLYKDLLLLETYAIMTYCSFSKILKKHDKVTKHNTRIAFMKNVVNKANFTHYPKLLEMISRCERLYGEVSHSLIVEGKSGLYEDERLFINMIHKLNEQVLDTAEGEGGADTEERKEYHRRSSQTPDRAAPQYSPSSSSISSQPSQMNTLRSLVEENAMNKSSKDGLARVAESEQTMNAMVTDEKMPARPVAKEQPTAGLPIESPEEGGGAKRLSSIGTASTTGEPSAKRAKAE